MLKYSFELVEFEKGQITVKFYWITLKFCVQKVQFSAFTK